jgi:hypothetical protein
MTLKGCVRLAELLALGSVLAGVYFSTGGTQDGLLTAAARYASLAAALLVGILFIRMLSDAEFRSDKQKVGVAAMGVTCIWLFAVAATLLTLDPPFQASIIVSGILGLMSFWALFKLMEAPPEL